MYLAICKNLVIWASHGNFKDNTMQIVFIFFTFLLKVLKLYLYVIRVLYYISSMTVSDVHSWTPRNNQMSQLCQILTKGSITSTHLLQILQK